MCLPFCCLLLPLVAFYLFSWMVPNPSPNQIQTAYPTNKQTNYKYKIHSITHRKKKIYTFITPSSAIFLFLFLSKKKKDHVKKHAPHD